MKKTLFAFIICSVFFLFITSCPAPDSEKPVEPSVDKWDGSISALPIPVDGVYEISTPGELAAVADKVNKGDDFKDKTIKLIEDIDLNNKPWTPIAQGGYRVTNQDAVFKGIFDGNSKTISNLTNKGYEPESFEYKTGENGTYAFGLFGKTEGAIIKDLTLKNVDIDTLLYEGDEPKVDEYGSAYGGDSVAALIGYSYGSIDISNVKVSGKITGYDSVGSIIGRAYGTGSEISVKKCNNSADVTSYFKTGGIIGFASPNAKATEASSGKLVIQECVNSGNISSKCKHSKAAGGVNDGPYIAGIATFGGVNGKNDSIDISKNTNKGKISEDNGYCISYICQNASYPINETGDNCIFNDNKNEGTIEIISLKDKEWYKTKNVPNNGNLCTRSATTIVKKDANDNDNCMTGDNFDSYKSVESNKMSSSN